MKVKFIVFFVFLIYSMCCFSDKYCYGTIGFIKKETNRDYFSIYFNIEDGSGGGAWWYTMDSKSSESIALLAFASKSRLLVYWSSSGITGCSNPGGPSNYQVLDGWMWIEPS